MDALLHSSTALSAGRARNILFACTYNSIRSPMAAALLRHALGDSRVFVDSVGVHAGGIDYQAVAVMAELGIDLSRHRSRSFADLHGFAYDLVITLSPEAQHHAVELTRTVNCTVEFWKTFDPTAVPGGREARLPAFRNVRDGLMKRIADRFSCHVEAVEG